jgi:hypothetical protein
MNDLRFAELLHLHLDHETTPAQAVEFEEELNRSPARRREYAAYRRMHHACAQLFEREQSQAPASFALERARLDAERKTDRQTMRPPARGPLVAAFAGITAMAACLALVLTRLDPTPSTATGQAGTANTTFATVTRPSAPSASANPSTTFASYVPPASGETKQSASIMASNPVVSGGLERVELSRFASPMELPPLLPIVVDDFVVQPHLSVQQIMAITRNTGTQPPAAQTAAFQFQR